MPKYLILIFSLLLFACSSEKTTEATQTEANVAPKAPSLSFTIQSISKRFSGCATDSSACATVDISVPQATGVAAADPINARITGALVEAIDMGEVRSTGLNSAVDAYMASYGDFVTEMKEDGMDFISSWAFEVEGSVLFRDSQYVCIELPYYTFMGGAHPNTFTQLLTFNARTGEEIHVLDLVADTNQLKLKAEEAFRAARELSADIPFEQEGFFWGKGFQLSKNIGMVEEGLYFVYDPYEAAPYALGPTKFVVETELLVAP